MRIGVNTGEVLVGALRAGGAITAMGDVVNTASRLQTSAQPGEVVVGGPTYAATHGVIAYEPRGLLAARGREERVEAWSAVETLLPPGYRPRRPTVPLVGRDTELALLRNALDSSISNSRALLVLVVGDAGLGKTRLAAELADWAVVEHDAIALEGRCVPYGEANVWWPVAEALRQACFLEPTAGLDEARSRTVDRVAQAFHLPHDDGEVTRVSNGILHLLGYEGVLRAGDQSSAREEAAQAVVSFVEASTGNQPVVIQLSDLHWADAAVVELIDVLLERLARRPYVLVATARQGIRERWSPEARTAQRHRRQPRSARVARLPRSSSSRWSAGRCPTTCATRCSTAAAATRSSSRSWSRWSASARRPRARRRGDRARAARPARTPSGAWWRPASTASAPTSAPCSPTPRCSAAEARSSTSAASTST